MTKGSPKINMFLPKQLTPSKFQLLKTTPDNFFKYIVIVFFILTLFCVILHIASFLIIYVIWFVFIVLLLSGLWLIIHHCKLLGQRKK